MLRHTYATELVMSGVNPVVVKDLMRHSDISIQTSSTKYYFIKSFRNNFDTFANVELSLLAPK